MICGYVVLTHYTSEPWFSEFMAVHLTRNDPFKLESQRSLNNPEFALRRMYQQSVDVQISSQGALGEGDGCEDRVPTL